MSDVILLEQETQPDLSTMDIEVQRLQREHDELKVRLSELNERVYLSPVEEVDIIDKFVEKRGVLTYYNFELRDHTLVAATVWKKRVFIICIKASARQWRNSAEKLRNTMKSFNILTELA